MRVLVADDDAAFRRLLSSLLGKWGYVVTTASDGEEARRVLEGDQPPALALLDWMMPKLDGVALCRRLRESGIKPLYLILLTSRGQQEDVVEGLDAGANDFVTKPFEPEELHARLRVGERVVELESELLCRVGELEDALTQVKTLRGLLPICSYCKKIRDDQNYWQQVESYITNHSDARFTHGICPDCYEKHVKPQLEQAREQHDARNEDEPPEQ